MHTLEDNQHIEKIETGGTKIGGNLRGKMMKELEKNKQINGLFQDKMIDADQTGLHTINMKNKAFTDIAFLSKMMCNEDFAKI